MANTLAVGTITTDLTASTITITDGTTYSSPARAGVGVFMDVYKVDYNSAKTLLTTTGDASDADSDATWTSTFTTDGWYKIVMVAPADYAGGTTYAQYDAAFDPATDYVYRSKTAGNTGNALTNTTYWERITRPTDLAFNVGTATASANLDSLIYNTILYPITRVNFGTKTGEAFLEASSDYRRSKDVRLYELLNVAVNAMNLANDRAEYAEGEKYARRAISLCSAC